MPEPERYRVANQRSDYDSLRDDLASSVESIDKELNALRELIKENKTERKEEHKELRERIGTLEKWQWLCYGIAAAVSAIGGYLLKALGLSE